MSELGETWTRGEAVVARRRGGVIVEGTVERVNRARKQVIVRATIGGESVAIGVPFADVIRKRYSSPAATERAVELRGVLVGRCKVQTMADEATRARIREIAKRERVTEGAVVRELLSLGFAAKAVRA